MSAACCAARCAPARGAQRPEHCPENLHAAGACDSAGAQATRGPHGGWPAQVPLDGQLKQTVWDAARLTWDNAYGGRQLADAAGFKMPSVDRILDAREWDAYNQVRHLPSSPPPPSPLTYVMLSRLPVQYFCPRQLGSRG